LKLKEHLYPEKYPLPLRNPITPAWKIKKLQRLEADRGINVEYPKPKWFI
jgi:large subunit ribosomal protein L15